ncbi:hypothetical protein TL16_g04243 [Triparma laevis f. inornata]|uniref:Uncharacterized protein n=1 Tax=Triparma laevis f. inornata TaxID=1714386 RepID=A0A9W7E576_9STRA|nr:hypothetical protein TL16_g04243 [Triparma laevis f. inornata]
MQKLMDLLDTTTTMCCSSYFNCPAFSVNSHHRDNVQTVLYPLLLTATSDHLSIYEMSMKVSETALSLESEVLSTYSQNSSLIRHRGRLLGFLTGVELSSLDRKTSRSTANPKNNGSPPTTTSTPTTTAPPPSNFKETLNNLQSLTTSLSTSFAAALNSPDPIKTLAQGTPPKQSTERTPQKHSQPKRKSSLQQVVKSFLSTVSATASPTLLLHSHVVAMVREMLAVIEVSHEIETVVKYTINRIESDLDNVKTDRPNSTEGKEKIQSQIKTFLQSPKNTVTDKFLRVENMFASKWDDTALVSKRMSAHLKNLLEYLSEENNSNQLVMSSYGERMLSRGIDPYLRKEFKEGEFESESALKDAYGKFHKHFKSIRLPPSDNFMCVNLGKEREFKAKAKNKYSEKSMMQALKDLKRERIFVNGCEVVDRKVTSKRELVKVLTEAIEKGVVNPKPNKKASNNNLLDESLLASESDYSTGFSSAPDNDMSNKESGDENLRRRRGGVEEKKVIARPRKFDTSKLTEIVSRILLASSRTGSGGDTLLFLNDLFGGDEVVLRPSSNENMQAAIEIDVYAGRVDIVCKAFYSVYLKADLEAPPMLYLRGKTIERIPLFVQRVEGEGEELGNVELKEVERMEGEDEGETGLGLGGD